MTKEYQVQYTVNGQGYAGPLPWIWDNAGSEEEALDYVAEVNEFLQGQPHEVWIIYREVSDWQRLDSNALPC